MTPLFRPYIATGCVDAARRVLSPRADGSVFVGEDREVEEFEREFQERLRIDNRPLMVNSGTSALWLALDLAGVGPGATVVSTPMTCAATNIAIRQRGARIIWADIDPATGNIDPASVERLLRRYPCRALITVDFGGCPVRMKELRAIADLAGVAWIDDAAHALLAEADGFRVGDAADFTCFSFQAIKQLTTADGGALVCRAKREEGRLKRWFGLDRLKGGFRSEQLISLLGYKFHMTDLAASIGRENLRDLGWVVARHRENARAYLRELDGLRGAKLPGWYGKSSWWLFTLRVKDPAGFIEQMAERGVQCAVSHRRNDRHPIFAGSGSDGDLAGLEGFDREQVQIPVGWWLTEDDRAAVVRAVREVVA